MVLGLIGGIGSGKSTVTKILEDRYGFIILRTDDIAKELELPGNIVYRELTDAFGTGILEEPGITNSPIDKAKLAQVIYSDNAALLRVNAIVHPRVWQYVRNAINSCGGGENTAVETALPDAEFADICDRVWYVYADDKIRTERLMKSRGYSEAKCISIINNQRSEAEFRKLADSILDNSGSEEETAGQIEELFK